MLEHMDRDELTAVLTTWRARLAPADVGIPAGRRRRTPGLRREELASLAGISVDYLSRLEQGRGPRPSVSVLSALARALRLSDAERDHLFTRAGSATPPPTVVPGVVRASVQRLLDRFSDLPAMLVDAKGTVLAWNDLAVALIGDFSAWPMEQRNLHWQRFLGSYDRLVATPDEAAATDQTLVGELQTVAARYPDDPALKRLIADLRRGSPRFEELWQRRLPVYRHSATKRFLHPELGLLELDCDALVVPETDQRIIVYSAAPRSPAAEALALLRVIGTQRLVDENG
jgi:transcriptional regulator with XRE-family HTH domain